VWVWVRGLALVRGALLALVLGHCELLQMASVAGPLSLQVD
jgi:hypothetical protein